jgi:hypothetical protein
MMTCAVLAALLAGCAGSGAATDAACAAFRPVYVGQADVLTAATAEQLLSHNITGAKLCGWRANSNRFTANGSSDSVRRDDQAE